MLHDADVRQSPRERPRPRPSVSPNPRPGEPVSRRRHFATRVKAMLRKGLAMSILGAGLAWAVLSVSAVAASPLDLVEILKDNTVSGHTTSDVPYNLYF